MARRKRAVETPPEEQPVRLPVGDWLTCRPASEIDEESLTWLWPERLAVGCPVLVEGRKEAGKSSICVAVAAALTGGPRLPGTRKRVSGSVLWLAGEDPIPTVLLPRLKAAGADLTRVHFPGSDQRGLYAQRPTLPSSLQELAVLAGKVQARLLIVDPIGAWCDTGLSLGDDEGSRLMMARLGEFGQQCSCGVMLTRNLTKGRSASALDAGRGCGTLGDAARGIYRCDPHPDQEGVSVMSYVAGNLGTRPESLLYRTPNWSGTGRLEWVGGCDLRAEAMAEHGGSAADQAERVEARQLVRRCVGNRWRSVREISAEALLAGISWAAVRKARVELNVPYRRVGGLGAAGSWEWGEPAGGWPKGL